MLQRKMMAQNSHGQRYSLTPTSAIYKTINYTRTPNHKVTQRHRKSMSIHSVEPKKCPNRSLSININKRNSFAKHFHLQSDSTDGQRYKDQNIVKKPLTLNRQKIMSTDSNNLNKAFDKKNKTIQDSGNKLIINDRYLQYQTAQQGLQYSEQVLEMLEQQNRRLKEQQKHIKNRNNQQYQQILLKLMQGRKECNKRKKQIDFVEQRIRNVQQYISEAIYKRSQ